MKYSIKNLNLFYFEIVRSQRVSTTIPVSNNRKIYSPSFDLQNQSLLTNQQQPIYNSGSFFGNAGAAPVYSSAASIYHAAPPSKMLSGSSGMQHSHQHYGYHHQQQHLPQQNMYINQGTYSSHSDIYTNNIDNLNCNNNNNNNNNMMETNFSRSSSINLI